jgi:hypothetical protein
MPVLRYYVGEDPRSLQVAARTAGGMQLLSPQEDETLLATQKVTFRWAEDTRAHIYRLEISKEGTPLFSAVINAGTTEYTAPSWLRDHTGKPLRWRVQALGTDGTPLAQSVWRSVQLQQ